MWETISENLFSALSQSMAIRVDLRRVLNGVHVDLRRVLNGVNGFRFFFP